MMIVWYIICKENTLSVWSWYSEHTSSISKTVFQTLMTNLLLIVVLWTLCYKPACFHQINHIVWKEKVFWDISPIWLQSGYFQMSGAFTNLFYSWKTSLVCLWKGETIQILICVNTFYTSLFSISRRLWQARGLRSVSAWSSGARSLQIKTRVKPQRGEITARPPAPNGTISNSEQLSAGRKPRLGGIYHVFRPNRRRWDVLFELAGNWSVWEYCW